MPTKLTIIEEKKVLAEIERDEEKVTLVRRALQLARVASLRARPISNAASESTVPAVSETIPSSLASQAPNYATTWSANQRQRPVAQSSPRFEQTVMELQPMPLSAMELIANVPARMVDSRTAECDGGGGPLGHPKIYINLDKPGSHPCGYCGLRFEQAPHHH